MQQSTKGGPVLFPQSSYFVVQNGLDFSKRCLCIRLLARAMFQIGLLFAAAGFGSLGVHGGPIGHSVEPTGYRVGFSDGCGFGSQHKKSCLEGVIDILLVAQDSVANRADELAVTTDERGEGVFVAVGHKSFQKLSVRPMPRCGIAGQLPQVAHDCV